MKKQYVPKLKVWKLKDAKAKQDFASAIAEQCLADSAVNSVDEGWEKLKKILLDTTEKVCGRTKGPAQRKATWWWDGDVDNVIKEKRHYGKNGRKVTAARRGILKQKEMQGG